jgi:ankyrin repeat protein
MRASARLISFLPIGLAALSLSAQQPQMNPDDRSFQAISQNNLAGLKAVVAERGPNTPDSSGLTPLVLASAFGTLESVKMLLALGAAVNGSALGGLTPLHVAWHDEAVVRTLLQNAATTIDATTQNGATPLWIAASATGTAEVIATLIAHRADPNTADSRGVTPLMAAATVGNSAAAMLLLDKGADPAAYAPAAIGHKSVTPLMGAAANADLTLARRIIQAGPDVNRRAPDNDGTVKNGQVALGGFTALHLAVASRDPEMVKLLIDARASIDAQDVRGFSPLVWAVATDGADRSVARMLVRAGANPQLKPTTGDTPVEWARRYNNPAILSELHIRPREAPANATVVSHPVSDARAAVERALPLLQSAATGMTMNGGCVACHAQPLTVMAETIAKTRGWGAGADTDLVQQIQRQQINSGLSAYLHGREQGGQPDTTAFGLLALSVADVPRSPATSAFVLYLVAKQRDAGNWHALTGRAPMQDGDITRTALGIRVLSHYGWPARGQALTSRVARAMRWLDAQQPGTTGERVMQLLGLFWGRTLNEDNLISRARELVRQQRPDGGWGQTPNLPSDAYATGQVLYALSTLKVPSVDDARRRGVEFLLRTQADDGSWHVVSRALKIQPYFESGFPYGHDQWISHAGSAWAVIGLAAAK